MEAAPLVPASAAGYWQFNRLCISTDGSEDNIHKSSGQQSYMQARGHLPSWFVFGPECHCTISEVGGEITKETFVLFRFFWGGGWRNQNILHMLASANKGCAMQENQRGGLLMLVRQRRACGKPRRSSRSRRIRGLAGWPKQRSGREGVDRESSSSGGGGVTDHTPSVCQSAPVAAARCRGHDGMSLLCVNFSLDSLVNGRSEPSWGQAKRPRTGVKLTTLGKLGWADLNPGSLLGT